MKKLFKLLNTQTDIYIANGQWFTEKEAIEFLIDYNEENFEDICDITNTNIKDFKDFRDFLYGAFKDDENRFSFLLEYNEFIDPHYYIYHPKNDQSITYGGEWDREEKVTEYLENNPDQIAECRFYI